MHKYLVLLITFFFSIAHADNMHYENQLIEKINIVVENLPRDANFDKNSVLSRMKTRAGDFFSHTDFDNDLKALSQEFDRVIPKFEMVQDKFYITLTIRPKPMIRTITWAGNETVKSKSLQKELGIPLNSVFDRQCFNKAFHKLKAYYVKQGFFEAELDYRINLDPYCNEVDIEVIICEGRAGKIKCINFNGFTAEEECELLEQIHTKKYNIFTGWFTNEGNFNEDAMQQDQFTILNYIQNEGYADAKVNVQIEEAPQKNRIIININLERGELYTFGDITIKGNTLFCTEDLMDQLEIATGEPYSPDCIRESISSLSDLYGSKGYIDTIIDFEPDEDCLNRLFHVHLTVEEGECFRVGMIKVFGNCITQTRVILHETILTPGEIFNTEKLQATEERLQNIGYFKNVNVYAVKSEGPCSLGGNYRDVHIEVEETGTGHFTTTGGFSTAENLFFGLNITEKNFNAAGIPYVWHEGLGILRGGGEYAHASATWGTKSRKYEIGWTKPYFRDTQWTIGFNIENTSTRYISDRYSIDATGLTLHTSLQTNPFLRVGWHYRVRDSHIHISDFHCEREKKKMHKKYLKKPKDFDDFRTKEEKDNNIVVDADELVRRAVNHKRDARHHSLRQLERQAKHEGIVSAVGTTLFYDSTNNPICPTEGFKSRLQAEIAGVGGYHSFFALGYLNNYYYPVSKTAVLKFRADIRFLIPYGKTKRDTIPIDERLFLGGDTFIRGYRQYRLGPKFDGDEDDPKGGTSLQYISLEYDKKLFSRVNGLIFFDGGSLTDRVFNFGRFYMSVGVGVRLKVLDSLPAISFGYAWPLNPRSNSDVKKFFFIWGAQF